MASPLFTLQAYIQHLLRAQNAHDLHSPFLFHFYREVVRQQHGDSETPLKRLRAKYRKSNKRVQFTDPKTGQSRTSTLGSLARNVSSSHRFSFFLIRLINQMGYQTVLETGTSVGLNTAYLAHSNASSIYTIEGSAEIAREAQEGFDQLGLQQINLRIGLVKEVFESVLNESTPGLIFLDADHRLETMRYYMDAIATHSPGTACIVIHDIYWSAGMKQAWQEIVGNPQYALTIDLFEAGVVFPSYPMEKQHFTLRL